MQKCHCIVVLRLYPFSWVSRRPLKGTKLSDKGDFIKQLAVIQVNCHRGG